MQKLKPINKWNARRCEVCHKVIENNLSGLCSECFKIKKDKQQEKLI